MANSNSAENDIADDNYSDNTTIMTIRNDILNASIISAFLFVVPVSCFSFYRFTLTGFKPLIIYHITGIVLLVLVMLFRNRLSYHLRAWTIAVIWFFVGVFGILTWGLTGMGIPWLLTLSIWAAMMLGNRIGILISMVSMVFMIVVCLCVYFNLIRFDIDFNTYSQTISAWFNATASFAFITVVVTACMWRMNSSLIRLATTSKQQVAELETIREQLEEKIIEHGETEEKRIRSEIEKKAILDGMQHNFITLIDPEMRIIWANEAAKNKIGAGYTGQLCHKLARGLDAPCPECVAVKAIETGEFCDGEVSRSNGKTYYVQCNPIITPEGEVTGIVVVDTDITERKQMEKELRQSKRKLETWVDERTMELAATNEALEQAVINSNKLATEAGVRNKLLAKEIEKRKQAEVVLKESESRYRSIIESIEEGYCEVDENSRFLFFNNALCQITGYTPKEMASKTGKDILAPECVKDVIANYSDVLETGEHKSEYYYDIIRKDGTRLKVETSISLITDINGKAVGFRGIVRDVDKRKKYEEQLIFQAYHDALTGLGNRKAFYERIEDVLNQAGRNKNQVALAFIDIDRFKEVNDTLGHEAGDLLLQIIAERLTGALRKTDYIFRLGGDEFTVILTQAENIQLEVIAKKIIDCLSRPYQLGDDMIDYVSASLGISLYPKHATNSRILIKSADIAMYKAKKERNRYVLYHDHGAL